jgi:hypothetical protein
MMPLIPRKERVRLSMSIRLKCIIITGQDSNSQVRMISGHERGEDIDISYWCILYTTTKWLRVPTATAKKPVATTRRPCLHPDAS